MPLNPEQPDAEEIQKQEQEKIDTAEPLTESQLEEREKLLQEVHKYVGDIEIHGNYAQRDLPTGLREILTSL